MNASAFIKVDKATFYKFIVNIADNERYEFVRGRIVLQPQGGTLGHANLARKFARVIERQRSERDWVVLSGSDRGVDTSETIRYPDVVVEPAGAHPESLSTAVPALIVEVLSPSSGDRDLIEKPAEYASIATLQAYVVASQTAAECLVWQRGANGHFPDEPATIQGFDKTIDIPSLSLSIPLEQVYRGVVSAPATQPKN